MDDVMVIINVREGGTEIGLEGGREVRREGGREGGRK